VLIEVPVTLFPRVLSLRVCDPNFTIRTYRHHTR
jgi:hypothetical protein